MSTRDPNHVIIIEIEDDSQRFVVLNMDDVPNGLWDTVLGDDEIFYILGPNQLKEDVMLFMCDQHKTDDCGMETIVFISCVEGRDWFKMTFKMFYRLYPESEEEELTEYEDSE